MTIQIAGWIISLAGTWVVQDGLASILYYLHHDSEKWYFNHAVRLIRMAIGVILLIVGFMLCFGGLS